MTINLNQEETTLLHEILETYLGDLRVEIHHTHTYEYKEQLHHEEAVLLGLLNRLPVPEDSLMALN